MTDMKKVIKGLEKVSYYFKSMLRVGYQGNADIYREHRESIKMAIALLKEQEEHEKLLTKIGYHWTGSGETLALCRMKDGEQE